MATSPIDSTTSSSTLSDIKSAADEGMQTSTETAEMTKKVALNDAKNKFIKQCGNSVKDAAP